MKVLASVHSRRLAPLLAADLESALPSAAKPLRLGGDEWEQQGMEQIGKKIEPIFMRYRNTWRALSEQADGAWDKQEKETLSRLWNELAQKSRQQGPGNSVPGDNGP